MLTRETFTRAATLNQTTELNVAREYCQHLFLSAFYQQAGSERVMFKGGTALRIAYNSPRFSEDLDFSGFGVTARVIEGWVLATIGEVERHGVGAQVRESKTTSGGYLSVMECHLADYPIRVLVEVSLRSQKKGGAPTGAARGRGVLITPELAPAYTLQLLPETQLVGEKITALLTRGKPRDYFDIYFLLRKNLIVPEHKPQLAAVQERLAASRLNFQRELSQFLPRSHHAILKNFRQTLTDELKRHGV